MYQEFFIRKDSVNPVLRMEIILDGRYDYRRSLMNNALQDCNVFFSMVDTETGILKVSNAKANIVLADDDGCEEKYIIEYKWNKRDTKKEGIYEGWFDIKFNGDIKEEGVDYPEGNLKVPILEKLVIYIKG